MIATMLCAIAGAIGLVRWGWQHSRSLALLGSTLAGFALLVLIGLEGAWGAAVGSATAMIVALLFILRAAWVAPARRRESSVIPTRTVLQAPSSKLPARLAVFMLTVPVAFAAAQWFAYGAQAIVRKGHAAEANTIVLMLLLQPLTWAALMTVQLTRSSPARMLAAPVITAGLGTILWAAA